MPYETLSNRNMSIATSMFEYVGDIVPIFYPLFLFVVFIIASFTTHFREKQLRGRSNLILCMMVGGWVTSIFAILLSLIDLVDIYTVVVCIVITVIFILISFVTKER